MHKSIKFYKSLDEESRQAMFIEMMAELEIDPETGKKYDYDFDPENNDTTNSDIETKDAEI